MNTKDGGSAFPVLYGQTNGADGMTLRDYFAARFAPELHRIACEDYRLDNRDESPTLREVALDAYRLADAMLIARAELRESPTGGAYAAFVENDG